MAIIILMGSFQITKIHAFSNFTNIILECNQICNLEKKTNKKMTFA